MNYVIYISPLTKLQERNLEKGKGVRVRQGDIPVGVNEKQFKRFNRNIKLGKSFTLKTTQKQGAGIISDIYRYIKERPVLRGMANRAINTGKQYAHRGVDYLSTKAHQKIREFPMIEGNGMRRRGRGLVGAALSGGGELAGMIGGPGSSEAKKWLQGIGTVANVFGLGMKKKKRTSSTGTRKKRQATPAQLQALALGRAIRDANRNANRDIIGSGRRKKYGTALRPAGY
jgi:hypothetical protein